uniref:Uncharacterized protein n=1 Tax=Arundo donax TaxID=35708 RepID=A0A0A9C4P4_ARUDO
MYDMVTRKIGFHAVKLLLIYQSPRIMA